MSGRWRGGRTDRQGQAHHHTGAVRQPRCGHRRPLPDHGVARHRDRAALGELIALRPCDIDFTARVVNVHRTLVEVSRKNSPTGERTFVKDYPKDDEPRVVQIEGSTCQVLREHMLAYGVRGTRCALRVRTAATRLAGTTSGPRSGCRPSSPPTSRPPPPSMGSAPRTPPGCSPAALICKS